VILLVSTLTLWRCADK